MTENLKVTDPKSLLVITQGGKLRKLFVPIAVKTMLAVGPLEAGATVYVEEVAEHKKYKIIYRIFNSWYPHSYFKL
jgi:hypothetical protein